MPDSDGLHDALWNKLQNLETECKLGVKVIDLWRFGMSSYKIAV